MGCKVSHTEGLNCVQFTCLDEAHPTLDQEFQIVHSIKTAKRTTFSHQVQRCVPVTTGALGTDISSGSLLITGGTGGVGMLVSEWFAQAGSAHVDLLSRSGVLKSDVNRIWTSLGKTQSNVCVKQSDVSNRLAVALALAHAPRARHLVHSAGVAADALIFNQTQSQLTITWGPKGSAAWKLHVHSAGSDFSSFSLFSSAAVVLGISGQAIYTASNGYLDGLAKLRHSLGLSAVSIQWGAWSTAGMAVRAGSMAKLESCGMSAITPQQGCHAFEFSLMHAADIPVVAFIPIHWAQFLQSMPEVQTRPFSAIIQQSKQSGTERQQSGVLARTQPRHLESIVRREIYNASHMEFGSDEPFMEAGLDSLAAIEICNQLARELGIKVHVGTLFNHATVNKLAVHLSTMITGCQAVETVVPAGPVAPRSSPKWSVGSQACVLPGANSVSEFWQELSVASDPICGVPGGRWDEQLYHEDITGANSNKCYVQSGGFVVRLERFDASFFRIPPAEATQMDPQQRLLLEVECP